MQVVLARDHAQFALPAARNSSFPSIAPKPHNAPPYPRKSQHPPPSPYPPQHLPVLPFTKRYRWTSDEDAELLELLKRYSVAEVSLMCGRTVSAVSQRRRTLLHKGRSEGNKAKTRVRSGSQSKTSETSRNHKSRSPTTPPELSTSPPGPPPATIPSTSTGPKLPSFADFQQAVLSDSKHPPPPPLEVLARISPRVTEPSSLPLSEPPAELVGRPRSLSLSEGVTQDAVREELRMTLTRIVGASRVGLTVEETEDLYVVQGAAERMLEKLWRTR